MPTDAWLNYYGLQRWEAVLDSDADGSSNEEEFRYGTDPRDGTSRPPRIFIQADGAGFEIPVVAGVDFGAAQLQTTTNLLDWVPVEGFPPAEPGLFTIPSRSDELARFFRIGTPLLANSDGDCLLDFEELNLFHTDPDVRIELGWLCVPEGPLLSEQASYTGAPSRRIAFAQGPSSRRSGLSLTITSPVLETALSLRYTRDFAGRLWILENRTPLPPTQVTNSQFQLQFWRNPRGDVAEVQRYRDQNGDVLVSQSSLVYTDPCGCRLDRVDDVIATNLPLPEATLEFGHAAGDELVTLLQGTNLLAFSHDAAGQLTAVHRNGANVESYTCDAVGNRLASHRQAT